MRTTRSTKPAPRKGHRPPTTPGAQTAPEGSAAPESNTGVDRGVVIGAGLRTLAHWSGRLILVAVALGIVLWLLAQVWVGLLPVILALILATVLWPPVAWMTARGVPPALASALALLLSGALLIGILVAIAPGVIEQGEEIADSAIEGAGQVQVWLAGPPLNLDTQQVDDALQSAIVWLQEQSSNIATGVFTGVTVVGSGLVTLGLVLVLTFFFVKDGPKFLPWLRTVAGRNAGHHLTEVMSRNWGTLGGFIRTQAIVSAVDAVLIGTGLLILGVPLALALAVLTFFAGFIPIVGAVTAGALAVLVALVTNGWQVALVVLALILVVQQVEGNVLQPMLQGRTMQMHAGIILLSVAAGGTIFGIVGAFLAVPVAASVVVTLRYVSEQVDVRTGDLSSAELAVLTPEGAAAAADGERVGRARRPRAETAADPTPDPPPQRRRGKRRSLLSRLLRR